jgi:hypothetical protein|tara:strand:+ start:177 stop:569 length:393 start_codon:yes stop_codon:yes gene_type:complete
MIDIPNVDPLTLRLQTDQLLERNVAELRQLLTLSISTIKKFPSIFPDSSLEAIEVEPREMESPDRGPIVVCPDGELYEMTVRAMFETIGIQEYSDRREEIRPLELPLHEYIAYLYSAIVAVSEYLVSENS